MRIAAVIAALMATLTGAPNGVVAQATPSRAELTKIFGQQDDQVRNALSGLAREQPGIADIYYVAVGGEAEEDVFMREAFATAHIMGEHFGTRQRTVVLVNNRRTANDLPLATHDNLKAVLAGIGDRMNRDEDILVLFMTSHGFRGTFSLSFNPARVPDLKPHQLDKILKDSGITHQVIILSACFSGSFIPKLKSENRLIITAARADRSSFGCASENEWTYFGNAFFNKAIRQTKSFTSAFKAAKVTVTEWEKRDKLTPPSEPQMSVGAAIAEKLKVTTGD